MSVVINISGDNAQEALRELAGLANGLGGKPSVSTPSDSGQAAPADTQKADKPSRTTRTAKPDPEPEKAAEPETETSADSDPQEGDDTPIPTVVELRAKAAEVGTTIEGKKAVKALLDEHEYQNISAVPEDKRVAFMRELEALQNAGD